jgi:acetylornithine deacetylase/succinyl-diaminopimelate desuccinylase-like protein
MPIGVGLEKIRVYLENNRDRHIARIQRYVRQPSISTENIGLRECAQLLVEFHKELGCHESELVETSDIAGVWAYYDAGAPTTIIVYGNFDTRPVLPHEQWEHPPFSGEVTSFGSFQQVLMGRGALAYKGPYIAWLNALEALKAVEGELPFNFMFLLEGDEILGSESYPAMYAKYRDRLATASASLSPGASQDASGRVMISLGFKGLIYAELVSSGLKWGRGPQAAPAHGMTKSVVDSPSWRLVHALATLTERDGNQVAVPGFYDDLTPPTETERGAARDFRAAMGGGTWNQILPGVAAVPTPLDNLSDEEAILHFFYAPSFNINGLRAGFTGPGTMPFTLPNMAAARLDIRVPRGFSVQKVVSQVRDHLDSQGYSDIELKVMAANDASHTGVETDLVRAIRKAFDDMEVPLVMAPYSGGGGPWSLFSTDLGLPIIRSVGVGGGGNSGAANEYLVIDGNDKVGGLVECELSHVHMLKAYLNMAG